MRINPKLFPLLVIGLFVLILSAARVAGYWQAKGGCGGGHGYHGGRARTASSRLEAGARQQASSTTPTAPRPGEKGFVCPLKDICEYDECDPAKCGILDGKSSPFRPSGAHRLEGGE